MITWATLRSKKRAEICIYMHMLHILSAMDEKHHQLDLGSLCTLDGGLQVQRNPLTRYKVSSWDRPLLLCEGNSWRLWKVSCFRERRAVRMLGSELKKKKKKGILLSSQKGHSFMFITRINVGTWMSVRGHFWLLSYYILFMIRKKKRGKCHSLTPINSSCKSWLKLITTHESVVKYSNSAHKDSNGQL